MLRLYASFYGMTIIDGRGQSITASSVHYEQKKVVYEINIAHKIILINSSTCQINQILKHDHITQRNQRNMFI